MGSTAVAEMLGGVPLGEQLQDGAAIFDGRVRSRRHDQAVGDFGGAGRN